MNSISIMVSRKRISFDNQYGKIVIFQLLNIDLRSLPHNMLFNMLYTYSFIGDYLFLTK